MIFFSVYRSYWFLETYPMKTHFIAHNRRLKKPIINIWKKDQKGRKNKKKNKWIKNPWNEIKQKRKKNHSLTSENCNNLFKFIFVLYFPVVPSNNACGIKASTRIGCGWFQITRNNCEFRGCCFDDKAEESQRCFYPNIGMMSFW